ncbi:MAG: hypothetical protein H6621_03750 [Halobacteriovoraceae bacterium]|nr:hypothetical protein [Halobacteriovoraceae bacterium]MCB9094162.1 hypothetical protein [Halobacteriovoraceae bacterium]
MRKNIFLRSIFIKSFLLLNTLFVSCSGYYLTKRVNPFAKYGVQSVSVPMFYNHSNLSDVSGYFTQEFTKILLEMKDLQVKSSSSKDVDAYFVGIINSPPSQMETLAISSKSEARDKTPQNAKDSKLIIPRRTIVNLSLDLYLIRRDNNSKNLVSLLREEHIKGLESVKHPGIIFREKMVVRAAFTRNIYDSESAVVNSTQNRGLLDKVLKSRAETAANQFKNLVLYVY